MCFILYISWRFFRCYMSSLTFFSASCFSKAVHTESQAESWHDPLSLWRIWLHHILMSICSRFLIGAPQSSDNLCSSPWAVVHLYTLGASGSVLILFNLHSTLKIPPPPFNLPSLCYLLLLLFPSPPPPFSKLISPWDYKWSLGKMW